MKKFLLLLTLFCTIFMGTAKATEVTIGDETSTTYSTYVPFYTLYNYGWSQQIFTAEEIGMAGTINSLTMWLYYTGSLSGINVSIYMAEVTEDEFASTSSWVALSESDLVYSGVLSNLPSSLAAVDAVTFDLDNPFVYSGSGNLLIAIANNTGSYSSGFNCRVSDAPNGAYMSLYAYRDASAYDIGAPGVSGTRLAKRDVITLDITPSGGSVTICDKPESLDITDITANGATLNWAGGSETYNVEYKKTSDDEWSVAVRNTTSTSIVLSGLDANTAYQARVQSVCGENTSGYKQANFKTSIALPYGENFDGLTAFPADWKRYSGVLIDDVLSGSATLSTTATSGFTFSSSTTGVFESKHMYVNIWSTYKYWCVLPAVPVEENVQLTFTMALTKSSTAYTAIATTGVDDKFVVLASVDDGATWSILRQWDNAGSENVYNNIALYGEEVTIDLSAYADQNVKIAFYGASTTSNADNYLHIDDVLIDYVPTCLKPTNLAEVTGSASKNSVQITWTANSGEENWKVQYKKDTAKVWSEPLDATAIPFTITGLDEFTEYNIRVAAFCDPADESTLTDYCKPIKVKTASGVPFKEGFSATALPSDWKRYSGLLEEVQNGTALEAASAGWEIKTLANGNGVFPDSARHLMLNIAGETCKYWIVSPTIEMEAGYQLTFDLALTTTSGTAVTAGGQPDDQFAVLVYDGTEWTALRTWSATSGFPYDEINSSVNGQVVKFDLSAYAGQSIQLAFYGESTEANGNNNLHISNVNIDLIPACSPATSLTIENIAATTASAIWTSEEEGTWQYGYIANPAATFVPADSNFVYSTTDLTVALSDLTETTTYAFFLRKACGESYSDVLVRFFTTIQTPAELPYENDFESTNGWLFINGECENAWAYGSAAHTGTSGHALYISNDGGLSHDYTKTSAAMVYAVKTFYFDEAGVYAFSYDWKCQGESTFDYLRVALVPAATELAAGTTLLSGLGTTTVPGGWVALDGGSKLNLDSVWSHKNVEIEIAQPGYYKVVLAWRDDTSGGTNPPAAVDNFSIARLECTQPSGLVISELGNTNVILAWNEESDGSTWEYAYALASAEEPETYLPIATTSLTIDELDYNTKYVFYLRKVCGGSYSESISLPFKTLNPYQLTVNNGTTTNTYVPVYGTWVDAYTSSQFIIPADSLTPILWDTITGLVFYSSTETVDWGAARFEVYMAETDETTLSATVSLAGLTKVMNASALFIEDNQMAVTFDTPFQYQGGNLLVAFNQTVPGTYKSATWYGVTATGASFGGYTSTSGSVSVSQRNFLPKMSLDFKLGVAPACPTPIHLSADSVTADAVLLSFDPQGTETAWAIRYKKTSEEEWADTIQVAASDSVWVTGLEASAMYNAQVAPVCDPADPESLGSFSSSITFMTACGAVATLNEDFENPATLACWSAIQEVFDYDGDYYYFPTLANASGKAHSGSIYFYFLSQFDGTPADQYGITPELVSLENMRVRFFARKEDATDEDITFYVGVMTDPSQASTFVAVDSFELNSIEYAQYAVSFADYTGEGKYIAIKMPASTVEYATLLIDDVIVDQIPSCMEPMGLAVVANSITPTSALLKWNPQGSESNWVVRYKLAADEDWISLNVTADSVLLTGLTPSSGYEAQVAAWCDPTDPETMSGFSSAVSFKTGYGIPFVEPFAGTVIPEDWSQYAGLLSDILDGTDVLSTASYWYFGAGSNGVFDNHARINIYGTSRYHWLVTPNIALTAAAQLTFDLALTKYSGTAVAVDQTQQADDKFVVLASTDNGATWTVLRQWDNVGSAYVYNNIATTGEEIAIDLSAYTGQQVILAFYGESTVSGGDNNLHIDNVTVDLIPSCIKPSALAVSNITATSAVLDWESDAAAWQIVYSADPELDLAEATLIDVTAKPYALAELLPDTLYKVYVRANCGAEDGVSVWNMISFKTVKSCQTPDNLAAADITTSSAAISWETYGQTGFNLRYIAGTDTVLVTNVESPYTITGLTAATAYKVQVQAACEAADSWSAALNIKTAYGVPFVENYDALTAFPADWTRYTGVLIDDVLSGSATLSTTATSGWNFSSSTTGVFESKHMYVNIWSTIKYWAVTPVVSTQSDDIQLTFRMALSKSSSTYNPAIATTGTDDKFVILISTDNGATWTILRQWDNAGSEYVYNNIGDEEVAINLNAYKNQSIKVAFYGASTTSNADNYLHIDDVRIDLIPACSKPASLNVDKVKAHTAEISWEAAEGQNAWQLAVDTIAAFNPDTLSTLIDVTENPYVLTNLLPNKTYYIYARTNCGAVDGFSAWTSRKSFKTTIACPAPSALEAELTPGNGTIATLTWKAGQDETAWVVEYSVNANMSDSVAVAVDDTVCYLTGLTPETKYYARVKADCGELDGVSLYSAVISFTPTSAYMLTINDGTATNGMVPVWGYNVDHNTHSQFIIPEADLEEIEWDSIKVLTFYSSNANVNWGAAEFEVYMAEAPATTIDADYDWNTLTLVKAAGSLSIVDNKMVVTLDDAYQYTGGNLLIGFNQTVTGSYGTSNWYGKNVTGASMGGYGSGNNYAQRNFLPKMSIEYVPGVAPACPNPKNLQVVSIAADSAVFSWKAVEGAAWEYAVALASAAEPTEFNAVPAGANAIVVNGLSELTSYVFYLRRNCGIDGYSEIVSVPFETLEIAEEISYSYSDDFEAATGWKLINGTETNAWMIGSAISNGGENALYISNDGAAYAYDDEAPSVTYASKLFHFVRTGTFTVSYDYKCIGEYNDEDGALDYLRVALLPADAALTAGVQLSDLGQALDHDSALVAQSAWTRKSAIASIPAVGLYRLVFIWSNDDSDSDGEPAAIDNLLIIHKDNATDIQSGAGIGNKAVKFMHNNQVYILLNGVIYNVTGQKVELR